MCVLTRLLQWMMWGFLQTAAAESWDVSDVSFTVKGGLCCSALTITFHNGKARTHTLKRLNDIPVCIAPKGLGWPSEHCSSRERDGCNKGRAVCVENYWKVFVWTRWGCKGFSGIRSLKHFAGNFWNKLKIFSGSAGRHFIVCESGFKLKATYF